MRTEMRVSLVLLGLFNSFVNVTCDSRPVGSDCVVGTKPGVCKKISDCASASNKLLCNQHPPSDEVCSFASKEKVVCCPKTDPSPFHSSCKEAISARISVDPLLVDAGKAVAKSIEMCDKYSSFKTQLRESSTDDQEDASEPLIRIVRSQNSLPADSAPEDYEEYGFGPRITNGTRAHVSEFPHMAAVGFSDSDTEVKCGGTLISEHFVLTAGHCLRDKRSVAAWVQLGISALGVDAPGNRYRVVERIAHPDYKPPALYNDIALLRLDRAARFDAAVHPACLQTERVNVGLSCTATGWGVTDWANPAMSNDLLKVLIQVQQTAKCNASFDNLIRSGKKLMRGVHDESTICAGDLTGGNDTCQGDSGGPIQVKLSGTNDMYAVIGVTSFGVRFCGTGQPSLYSRVSYFVPWIVGHVWPTQAEPKPETRPKINLPTGNTARPSSVLVTRATARPGWVYGQPLATDRPSSAQDVRATARPSSVLVTRATARPGWVYGQPLATDRPSSVQDVRATARPSWVYGQPLATDRPSSVQEIRATARPSSVREIRATARPGWVYGQPFPTGRPSSVREIRATTLTSPGQVQPTATTLKWAWG